MNGNQTIVDVHTHFFPPGYLSTLERSPESYAIAKDAEGRTILTLHASRVVTMTQAMTSPQDRLSDMDRLGITRQIISVTVPNVDVGPPSRRRDLARMANDGLAEVARRFPERFSAMASVPLEDPEAAAQELDRAVLDLGMVGVILGSNAGGRYLDDAALLPFYERAQSLRVPILVHPMPPMDPDATFTRGLGPLLGFVFNTTASVARMVLAGVFERIPGLTLIVAHLGGTLPYLMQRLDNGYLGLSRSPRDPSPSAEPLSQAALLRYGLLLRAVAPVRARDGRIGADLDGHGLPSRHWRYRGRAGEHQFARASPGGDRRDPWGDGDSRVRPAPGPRETIIG